MVATDRRAFLKQAGWAMGALAATGTLAGREAAGAEPGKRPNVLLIMTDDQGYGDFGCHGNPYVRTPNLDRLHDESLRFERFYVCPVCAPTRAGLMTGRYNYRTGAIDTYRGRAMMHPDEVTLAEMLSGAGYATGIFGKWHLGDCFPLRAMDHGFQESLVHHGGGIAQPSDPPGSGYYNPILMHNGQLEQQEGYCTDIFAQAAMDFIDRHHEEPFFVYLPTNAPHSPLVIHDDLVSPYKAMGLPDNVARVYAMITNVDENVGKVLAKLDEHQVADNTIVVFLTDNGAQNSGGDNRFNAGSRDWKGSVYEGGIRVPCFVRWPARIKPGKEIDRIAANIDLTPTLLEACGVQAPANLAFDGRSLLPLWERRGEDWPERTLFFQWHRGDFPEPYNNCAARTQQYKLVNGVELYDISADPGEEHDIAAEHPDRVKDLRRQYEAWLEDVCGTRGFFPPRIILGDERANPVTLTLQDQREGEGGGYGLGGYWSVDVAREGRYEITLRFDDAVFPGEATFRLGGVTAHTALPQGSASCTLNDVWLPAGPGSVRGFVSANRDSRGAKYVDIRRIS